MASSIALVNKRQTGGSLFHYGHFIIDCLYPDIINGAYNYDTIYRIKNLKQTLGNFSKLYEEVMLNETIELAETEINCLSPVVYKPKEVYTDIESLEVFRNFIFKRYSIHPDLYIPGYPEVILIKRGERMELINDEELQKVNLNVTTGRERREIANIDVLDTYLKTTFSNRYQSFYMEKQPFEEQVKIFNNAKLIIMAHGSALANILFCKEGTQLVNVTCGINYIWFNTCFQNLKINHIQCMNNKIHEVIDHIPKI